MSAAASPLPVDDNKGEETHNSPLQLVNKNAGIYTHSQVAIDRLEFTRQWLAAFLLLPMDLRWEQLKAILCDMKMGEENIMTRLKLDYEFESGCTIGVLLLYYLCVDTVRIKASDLKRKGFAFSLLANFRQYGYYSFTPFDSTRLNLVLGRHLVLGQQFQVDLAWSVQSPNDDKGNILTLLLALLNRGRLTRPGTTGEYVSCEEESGFIQFMEEIIRVMLEQATLTGDTKSSFLNMFSRIGDWTGCSRSNSGTTPLGLITSDATYGRDYLSLVRLLISHGADICVAENGSESPLVNAFRSHRVELVLEMFVSQSNLMNVFRTQMMKAGPFTLSTSYSSTWLTSTWRISDIQGFRYSTPKKLLKQILLRFTQWQEEQQKQFLLDSTFRSNDTVIREWLQQQLLSLPNLLFAATMQQSMHQSSAYVADSPSVAYKESCHRDCCRGWIHQLRTAPDLINLLELSFDQRHIFLVDSLEVLLDQELVPYYDQLLGLLDGLSLVDSLILFGSCVNGDETPDYFCDPLTRLRDDHLVHHDPDGHQQKFLLRLIDIMIQRLDHTLQLHHQQWKNDNHNHLLLELRMSSGYDPTDNSHDFQLLTDFAQSMRYIEKEAPGMLLKMVRTIGSACSVEVFLALWTKILPSLELFRINEVKYRYELIRQLLRSTSRDPCDRSLERVQSFLNQPFLLSTDLFEPFEMFQFRDEHQGSTIVQVAKNINNWRGGYPNDLRQPIIDFVCELESAWINIHLPAIRKQVEEFLIPDLAGIVFTLLQPSQAAAPITATVSSSSAFTFDLLPAFSNAKFSFSIPNF